ncbi:MAG: hypothetical protein JKP98_04145 [Rhodobacteraceae bacterium]|nr:hypothetical protein [Paracoccaceae bacterium]
MALPARLGGVPDPGIPGVFIAGSLIGGGPVLAPLPPEGLAPVLAAMATMLFLGPVEELGWRG